MAATFASSGVYAIGNFDPGTAVLSRRWRGPHRNVARMSRLDFFIHRLTAQRACLNRAAELIRGLDGFVLELGLGNGRSYDHLRELFPTRDIYVCERQVGAHPACIPPAERLLLGDLREMLPQARSWLTGKVALAHVDIGSGDPAVDKARAAETWPLVAPLLRPDGVVASDLTMDCPELRALPLPDGAAAGRYHLYQLSPSDCEPVKVGNVSAGDLETVVGARILEVALDNLLRVRP
jgi:hypothetical protein